MDKVYMRKAIRLARKGWGRVSPNPMVGAVIVKRGQVVAEGYHRIAGEPHAEAEALKKGYGVDSARKGKKMRMAQAAAIYEHIYFQYPKTIRTDEALYEAAFIQFKYLKDYNKAKELFSRLISDCPDSRYEPKARSYYGSIEKKQKKAVKKKK